jgi:hypothetical protein
VPAPGANISSGPTDYDFRHAIVHYAEDWCTEQKTPIPCISAWGYTTVRKKHWNEQRFLVWREWTHVRIWKVINGVRKCVGERSHWRQERWVHVIWTSTGTQPQPQKPYRKRSLSGPPTVAGWTWPQFALYR